MLAQLYFPTDRSFRRYQYSVRRGTNSAGLFDQSPLDVIFLHLATLGGGMDSGQWAKVDPTLFVDV